MVRPRRSVAILCIAVVALTAFLPGVCALDYAVPQPSFVLLPDLAASVVPHDTSSPDPRPVFLGRRAPSRAPPAIGTVREA
jgi:hypothetical protein